MFKFSRALLQYLDEYDAWAAHNASSLNATSNSATSNSLNEQQLGSGSPNMSGGGGGISFWKSPPSEHSFQRFVPRKSHVRIPLKVEFPH